MREGERIRVKCLAAERPRLDAVSVRDNLEDDYLWLMKSKNKTKHVELSPAVV
jgi:hypothetical protein